MSSYFPKRWPLSYLNLTKNMKKRHKAPTAQTYFKHQDIKQKEPPQKYRLGTISETKLLAGLNRFYMAIIQTDCKQSMRIGKIRALNWCTFFNNCARKIKSSTIWRSHCPVLHRTIIRYWCNYFCYMEIHPTQFICM